MILINSSPKNASKIFQPFLPIFVPVGVGCLISVLDREGIKARIIDEQIEDNILGLVSKYIREMERPYIFAFSVLTAGFKNAISVSRELKRIYPDSVIVFGGIHSTAMPDEVLSYGHIDAVLRGEGEELLSKFYKCVKAKKDFTHLDNISYKINGHIIHNKMNFVLNDLNSYPDFPYHLFNPKRYDLGFILSSRGCPHECIFCSNRVTTGRRYRFRYAEVIIDELEMLYNKYNRRHILFVDDNLLVDKERIYKIIDNVKIKGLDKKMIFNFQARGDNVNYRLLKDLYDAGFKHIFFGLETSSERIMKIIKKNESVAQCIEAVKMAKKIGFHVSATFIYGLPGETYRDRMLCVRLAKDLKLDMLRFNNAAPYPGTELYEIAKRENRLNIQGLYENFSAVSTFIENPFKRIPLPYFPEGNTEEEIRRDILYSYFSFYFDTNRLKNVIDRSSESVGWFNLGENIAELFRKVPALLFLGFMLSFKFWQLFYYMTIKKETAIYFKQFKKYSAAQKNKG